MLTDNGAPIVVDTNIVSYLYRGDTRASKYESLVAESRPSISIVTVGELLYGAYRANWSERRTNDLIEFIQSFDIVDIYWTVAEYWGRIRAEASAAGKTLPLTDAWIAATALTLECPLVTHNPSDFASIEDLQVISYV